MREYRKGDVYAAYIASPAYKEGQRKASAKFYSTHKRKEYLRAYYAKDPMRHRKDARSRHLKSRYGLSLDGYEQVFTKQNGRCLICNRAPSTKPLAVDHDHVTGETRGLLCDSCNRSLGWYEKWTAEANAYLEMFNNDTER